MRNSISTSHLFIETTRKCTLQCKHCMRGEKQDVTITKEIIDRIFTEINDCKSVSLAGGEPLLAIEMIEYIVNKIIENQWNVKLFQITTNGTIIDKRIIDILYQLHIAKNDCLVLLRISGDEFHDKSITEFAFKTYSDMIADKSIQIKITDEVTMFEYAGRGKEYINQTKNQKYIKNIVAQFPEKYYIRFENNILFCPITISSNGNVTMFNCGEKEYAKIDELSMGNILHQSLKEIIHNHNRQCLLSCLEYENLLSAKSTLLRFDLTNEEDKNEDYYLGVMADIIFNSILNARKEAKRLYPKLPSYEIIKILPMPKNSFLSILDLMNYMYNSIENKMKHYTNWEELFLSSTDEVLYDIYMKQNSVIGIGMTKWLCVIAALKQPDLIDKSCIKEFCNNSYLKYYFSTDISILPEFSLLKDIENKYKIDSTYIVDSQLPCGETLFINGYCI